MTALVTAPKANPAGIAKIALDGIEAGSYEIVADEPSRQVLAGLSGGVAALRPHKKSMLWWRRCNAKTAVRSA